MHKYTIVLLGFLFAGMVLLAPSVLRADIVAPDPVPYTFENQQKLAVSFETGSGSFATSSIPVGSTQDIRYSLWFNEAFTRDYGDITPGHEAAVFQTALEDHRVFLELWRGEPFTPEATVVQQWELPATTTGNLSMTFPEAGPYFLVAYLANEVRDEAAYCIRYEVPQEYCAEDGFFSHFTPEETQRYFTGDFGDDVGLHDSNPVAFGGTRLSVTGVSGVSNVLFLPGIKGTRLYRPASGCTDGSSDCATQLWEPHRNEVIYQMFLDEFGASNNRDIYARADDVISEVLSQRLYASFFKDLDAVKSDGTFGAGWTWEAAAYDWRLSLNDIVSRGLRQDDRINYADVDGTPYIERTLRDLAATSPTGKVTLVAHSNGGLVAKALMERLGDAETAALIDKVIFVGVPQSGAPRALGAALFGYGEALPFDECADWFGLQTLCSILVDRQTARYFGEHSPMTYHLLPSEAYFRDTGGTLPPARFNATHLYQNELQAYGDSVDTFDELARFARADEGGRTKPAFEDIAHANILSEYLLTYARDIHRVLDAWAPPPGVEVYELGGWGNETLSGIEFYEEPRALGLFGSPIPRYRPTFMDSGDGVVPNVSALMMAAGDSVHRYWVDLQGAKRSHADLFELPDVRTFIRGVLTGTSADDTGRVHANEPVREARKRLLFFLHSPLTLGINDDAGRYTGLNEDGKVAQEADDIEYGQFGETQYLIVPAGRIYTVVLHGLSTGTFALDMQEQQGDDVIRTTTIANVPSTETTEATLYIGADASLSALSVDANGDGTVDADIALTLGETVVYDGTIVPVETPEDEEPEPEEPDPETPEGEVPIEEPPASEDDSLPGQGSSGSSGSSVRSTSSRAEGANDTSDESVTIAYYPPLAEDSGSAQTGQTIGTTTGVIIASGPSESPRALARMEVPGSLQREPSSALTASVFDAFRNAGMMTSVPLWLVLCVLLAALLGWIVGRRLTKS